MIKVYYNCPVLNTPLLVTLLLTVDSLHYVFARLLLPRISPSVSPMYVLAVATFEVGLYGLITGRLRLTTIRKHIWFFISIGFLIAVSTNVNYESVAFINPGTASLLSKTGTLFGLGLGIFWLGDKLSRPQIGGVVLALSGIFAIAYHPGEYLRLGSLLVLISAFLYALHAAVTKRYGGEMDLLNFFFFRLLFTTAFLFLFSASRRALVWPSINAWPLLLLVGTIDVVVGRMLYYMALRQLEMSIHTIVLTISPVATVLWSLLLFASAPTPQEVLGGLVIIAGVFVVTLLRTTKKTATS